VIIILEVVISKTWLAIVKDSKNERGGRRVVARQGGSLLPPHYMFLLSVMH